MIAWVLACFILAVLVYFLLGFATKKLVLRPSISISLFLALSGVGLFIVIHFRDV